MHTRAKLGYMLLGSMDDIMNRLVILLTICGLVISGCSETVDSTYNVPTLHLVLDSQHSSEYPHNSCVGMVHSVKIDCHVQSDRPMEYDTFVLIDAEDGSFEEAGKVGIFDCTTYGEGCERLLVAILAGDTQSQRLFLTARERDLRSSAVPKVVVTLPPAHERAGLLPRQISYTGIRGQKIEKELLVEYPFNPYNVGYPTIIRVKWQGEGDEVNGTQQNNEVSEIHELLNRWETSYEAGDIGAYMSILDAGFTYVADMGTPNNSNDDVKWGYRDERESALRVFSLYRNIQIKLVYPLEVELNESRTRAEVRTRYEITALVRDGVSLEGGYDGWYVEGDFLFVLQKTVQNRLVCQWRIISWFDKAIYKEGKERINKIATRFADVKSQ